MHSKRRREPALSRFLRTRSRAMRAVVDTAAKLVDRDVSVLISGESGSGKNYLAEALHACGPRREAPFVTIECASIPHELFESELFGYEKGTFTDAGARKIGKLEAARNGTTYFDEIAALTPPLQAKLLRALEERHFSRLGGSENVKFHARVVSSTSSDLAGFRSDLLYRINVVTLTIPPLRERAEDVPLLANDFLRKARKGARFDDEAMELLASYSWPGNIRELRNIVERAALLSDRDVIGPASLPVDRLREPAALVDAAVRNAWTLDQLEERYIREILRRTKENYSRAAQLLGINRKTLLEKRKKYGIE
ncbi:MAG TPA: sigma-54 dependent transcriptional regulator [Thermoanaerobaculia bacterium]